jgi:hypothetical protein
MYRYIYDIPKEIQFGRAPRASSQLRFGKPSAPALHADKARHRLPPPHARTGLLTLPNEIIVAVALFLPRRAVQDLAFVNCRLYRLFEEHLYHSPKHEPEPEKTEKRAKRTPKTGLFSLTPELACTIIAYLPFGSVLNLLRANRTLYTMVDAFYQDMTPDDVLKIMKTNNTAALRRCLDNGLNPMMDLDPENGRPLLLMAADLEGSPEIVTMLLETRQVDTREYCLVVSVPWYREPLEPSLSEEILRNAGVEYSEDIGRLPGDPRSMCIMGGGVRLVYAPGDEGLELEELD